MRQLEFCTQMAVCYRYAAATNYMVLNISGILALDHPNLVPIKDQNSPDGSRLSSEASSIMQAAIKMSLYLTEAFVKRTCDYISPFLLYLMYKATSICMVRRHDGNLSPLEERDVETMRSSLKHLAQRWHAAGEPCSWITVIMTLLTIYLDVYLSLLSRLEMILLVR